MTEVASTKTFQALYIIQIESLLQLIVAQVGYVLPFLHVRENHKYW